MQKAGFTLIEILVVLVILGFLSVMVMPAFDNITQMSRTNLNKTMMQDIKRASLAFKEDVGFTPDNVVLMIYPFEECSVADKNFNDSVNSLACKNMIAFVDSRLSLDSEYRESSVGDYGNNTLRKNALVKEITRRLDPKQNGWKGSYIGGNEHLRQEQIKLLGDGSAENANEYFLSKKDIELYYDGFNESDTLSYVGATEFRKWFCIEAADFNGSRGGGSTIKSDEYYDVAKYHDNLKGELTILDPWGTPYEIQFPSQSVIPSGKSRERFARIVSFGKNRKRDTNVDATLPMDFNALNYDDSVLYIFENDQTSYFHQL